MEREKQWLRAVCLCEKHQVTAGFVNPQVQHFRRDAGVEDYCGARAAR